MKLILATFAMFSFAASAQGGAGSEYQHQTPVDKMEVRALLGYKSFTAKGKTGGKSEISGLSQTAAFEYGATEMVSAGVELSNANFDNKSTPSGGATTTTKISGLNDMVFFLNARNPLGSGELRFGTQANFSLGKSKTESNGNTNNASGGLGLTPFVGYEMAAGAGTFGGRLSYQLWLGDRKDTDETSTPADENTYSGGNVFTTAFFYEMPMAAATVGGALEISSYDKADIKTNGTSAGKTSSHTETALAIYAPYYVNEMTTILPKFRYNMWNAVPNGYDSANGWDLTVGARFVF